MKNLNQSLEKKLVEYGFFNKSNAKEYLLHRGEDEKNSLAALFHLVARESILGSNDMVLRNTILR